MNFMFSKGKGASMSFRDKFKAVLSDKDVSITEFADMQGLARQTVANTLYRDAINYNNLEEWLDTLDVDIVFIDRKTRKRYT